VLAVVVGGLGVVCVALRDQQQLSELIALLFGQAGE
jgi:hypothetical protein